MSLPPARSLAVSLLLAALACSDSTAPAERRARIPAADSLLVASLAGPFAYAETTLVSWGSAGSPRRFLEVSSGRLEATVTSAVTVSLARHGTRSAWSDSLTVELEQPDSAIGLLWLQSDSLRRFGGGLSFNLPRAAASDSGLHFVTTDPASSGCELLESLFVSSDAADVECRVAVHWRRDPSQAR